MTRKRTPFDEIIVKLTVYLFSKHKTPNVIASLIQHHLQILRVIYLRMIEEDFYEKTRNKIPESRIVPLEEAALETTHDSISVNLNYLQFVFVLNQFGRVLKIHELIKDYREFPNFYRIRFYRNCAGEHWDRYVSSFIYRSGFTFTHLKASIPIIEEAVNPQEKDLITKSLVREFLKARVRMRIPRKFTEYNAMSSNEKYCNYLYRKLQEISPKLISDPKNKKVVIIPKSIVSLLFDFGFPAPITDIEKYTGFLIRNVLKILNKNKILLS